VQMACGADLPMTLAAALARTAEAARQGATDVCLPEPARCPCFCEGEERELFALPWLVPGPTMQQPTQPGRRGIIRAIAPRRIPVVVLNPAG